MCAYDSRACEGARRLADQVRHDPFLFIRERKTPGKRKPLSRLRPLKSHRNQRPNSTGVKAGACFAHGSSQPSSPSWPSHVDFHPRAHAMLHRLGGGPFVRGRDGVRHAFAHASRRRTHRDQDAVGDADRPGRARPSQAAARDEVRSRTLSCAGFDHTRRTARASRETESDPRRSTRRNGAPESNRGCAPDQTRETSDNAPSWHHVCSVYGPSAPRLRASCDHSECPPAAQFFRNRNLCIRRRSLASAAVCAGEIMSQFSRPGLESANSIHPKCLLPRASEGPWRLADEARHDHPLVPFVCPIRFPAPKICFSSPPRSASVAPDKAKGF